jgi:hypothetical protein
MNCRSGLACLLAIACLAASPLPRLGNELSDPCQGEILREIQSLNPKVNVGCDHASNCDCDRQCSSDHYAPDDSSSSFFASCATWALAMSGNSDALYLWCSKSACAAAHVAMTVPPDYSLWPCILSASLRHFPNGPLRKYIVLEIHNWPASNRAFCYELYADHGWHDLTSAAQFDSQNNTLLIGINDDIAYPTLGSRARAYLAQVHSKH